MWKKGRSVVPIDPSELLYFRWFADHIKVDGLPNEMNVSVPDQSANRSGLGGRCWHVLIADPMDRTKITDIELYRKLHSRTLCMGVLQIAAKTLECTFEFKGVEFRFGIEHDPLDWNYLHCELRVSRNGVRFLKSEADSLKRDEKADFTEVKKLYRLKVAERLRDAGSGLFPVPAIEATSSGGAATGRRN